MGTDEIALPVFVGAMFDFYWNDHAGELPRSGRPTVCPTPEPAHGS
jgi:hypothetical protein